jgi:hypothetical protein
VAQEKILDILPSDELRLYVVWTPVLREDKRNTTVAEHSVVGTVGNTTGHGVSGDDFFTASERTATFQTGSRIAIR